MEGQISSSEKSDRSRRLMRAAEVGAQRFLSDCIGKNRQTLIFGAGKGRAATAYRGITDNGIEISAPPAEPYLGKENVFADLLLTKEMVANNDEAGL
jgi:tRNA A37 methylthiotransferase MiaB